MNKRIIYMGTPEISSFYLESLIKDKYNICAVFSQPPRKKGRGMLLESSPVHKLAKLNNTTTYTPTNIDSEKIKKDIRELKPSLIIVMGYGIKLPNDILKVPQFGCINIHVSLLPRWRGAAPIEHSLLHGDKSTGVTIFKLVEEMDAGPIFYQKSINIDDNINRGELTKKLNIIGINLLKYALQYVKLPLSL